MVTIGRILIMIVVFVGMIIMVVILANGFKATILHGMQVIASFITIHTT